MKSEEYLEQRLDDQIAWYSAKSTFNQRRYRLLQIISIVAAALIPLVAGIGSFPVNSVEVFNIVVGALGVAVAISTGLQNLYNYQEQWIKYRTTSEALTREKFKFLAAVDIYKNPDAFQILVIRVEALLSNENANWEKLMRENPDKDENAP